MMSLFSGDCQELAPCAVPVHELGQIRNYGTTNVSSNVTSASSRLTVGGPTATTTTAAVVHPHSRRSSTATAIESAEGNGGESVDCYNENRQRLETDDQRSANDVGEGESSNERGVDPENQLEGNETKITPAPSSVTRYAKYLFFFAIHEEAFF